MTIEIRVPTLGESVTEATVATWFKKPGDVVAVDDMLCELETDKVTVEVPSPVAGTMSEIIAAEGTTVGSPPCWPRSAKRRPVPNPATPPGRAQGRPRFRHPLQRTPKMRHRPRNSWPKTACPAMR